MPSRKFQCPMSVVEPIGISRACLAHYIVLYCIALTLYFNNVIQLLLLHCIVYKISIIYIITIFIINYIKLFIILFYILCIIIKVQIFNALIESKVGILWCIVMQLLKLPNIGQQ